MPNENLDRLERILALKPGDPAPADLALRALGSQVLRKLERGEYILVLRSRVESIVVDLKRLEQLEIKHGESSNATPEPGAGAGSQ